MPKVKQQIKNYARFRALVEHWVDLATELADLRLTKTMEQAQARK